MVMEEERKMDIKLRGLRSEDKEPYILLQREYWVNKKALDDVGTRDGLWQGLQEEKRIDRVIAMPDGEFCGFCGVKDRYLAIPEIEIEILEKYTGQGIGYTAMMLFLKDLEERTGKTRYLTQVIPDNYPSIKLMQKCGAIPYKVGMHPLLNEEEAEEFADQHAHLMTGESIQLAEIFGVKVEKILSGVLHFHIDRGDMTQERFRLEWRKEGKFERKLEKAVMVYILRTHLARLRGSDKMAAGGNAQKLSQMLKGYQEDLEAKLKRIDSGM